MLSTRRAATRRKWRYLREALAGTTQDFTQGSLTRGIALLAIPTILEMVMESTFGVVDAFWVARTAMLQYFISTASWLSLARINAAFGSHAVAGYSLAIRIILFALMPSWGICSAAATLVGQNLGAKRPDRGERAVWLAGLYNMGVLTVAGVVFFAAARPLVSVFHPGALVVPIAVTCLQYVSLGYPFYAWGMVMERAFNGAGDTATPTWINFGCTGACRSRWRGTWRSISARAESISRAAGRSRC
jgi:Na+-driven multidrug efflux pump